MNKKETCYDVCHKLANDMIDNIYTNKTKEEQQAFEKWLEDLDKRFRGK